MFFPGRRPLRYDGSWLLPTQRARFELLPISTTSFIRAEFPSRVRSLFLQLWMLCLPLFIDCLWTVLHLVPYGRHLPTLHFRPSAPPGLDYADRGSFSPPPFLLNRDCRWPPHFWTLIGPRPAPSEGHRHWSSTILLQLVLTSRTLGLRLGVRFRTYFLLFYY